eukprot:scaffold4516_cov417-Prasinococcus_capsulatus_cf.AAC.16
MVSLDGGSAISLFGRGQTNLLLSNWAEAVNDLSAAIPLLSEARSSELVYLPTGKTLPKEVVEQSLAWDGIGLAKMAVGKFDEALHAFEQALGVLAVSGAFASEIPVGTPYSGLRGGAPSVGQRVELHKALAMFGSGGTTCTYVQVAQQQYRLHHSCCLSSDRNDASVALLRKIDKGPSPDGSAQFWDARAALVAALWHNGFEKEAESEWESLCKPAAPPPPATPTNPVFANVNRMAQAMLDADGALLDNACEDYESGVFLPCNDAGIPGLGGLAEPCAVYTEEEVKIRRWPPIAVQALKDFRQKRRIN